MTEIFNQISNCKHLQIIGPMEINIKQINANIPTILIDGGANHLKKLPQLQQSWKMGDGDSAISIETFDIKLPTSKDQSDLLYCLDSINQKNHLIEIMTLYGFSHGRKDHEIFVIGDALNFIQNNSTAIYLSGLNFLLFKGKIQVSYQDLFSLGCQKESKVTIQGECQFQIQEALLRPFSSQGLSNLGQGRFEIDSSSPSWIYFDDPSKINAVIYNNKSIEDMING